MVHDVDIVGTDSGDLAENLGFDQVEGAKDQTTSISSSEKLIGEESSLHHPIPFEASAVSSKLHTEAVDTWLSILGGTDYDYGYSVVEASDGGFIITGYTDSFGAGNSDVLLAKVDNLGALIWAKAIGGASLDRGYSVQETADGGFIVTGHTASFGAGLDDIFLAKVNSGGALVWAKALGETNYDRGNFIQETSDNGFVITGYTFSFGAGNSDVFLSKVDSGGALIWAKSIGGAAWDEGSSVKETLDGGFVIGGYTHSFGAVKYDIFLAKVDSGGTLLWAKTFGPLYEGYDYSYSVQETADGGNVIAGYTYGFGTGGADVFFAKVDNVGALLWAEVLGGIGNDFGRSVQKTADGGFIITGRTNSFGKGSYNVFLSKMDSGGALLWTKVFGGTDKDYSESVQETADGGFIIGGYTRSFGAGDRDIFLAKVDANGEMIDCSRVQDITALMAVTNIMGILTVTDVTPTVTDISPTVTDITGSLIVQDVAPENEIICPATPTPTPLIPTPTGRFPTPTHQLPSTPTPTPLIPTPTGRFQTPTPFISTLLPPSSPWIISFGESGTDYGRSVQGTADGGFVIAGYTDSFGAGNYDIFLAKVNSAGTLLWAKAFGEADNDYGYSMQGTADGGFIIAGYTDSFGAGNYDILLIKVDTAGTLLWTEVFGEADNDYSRFIQETSDGGFIITGYTDSFGAGNSDVLLAKVDNLGALIWAKAIGGASLDRGYSVQETADGGFIVTGYTRSFGAGGSDIFLAKVDSVGDLLWAKVFGGRSTDIGYFVQETADGGFIVTGYTDESFGDEDRDVFLAKVNNVGVPQWAVAFVGPVEEEGYCVQETTDNGFIVTGKIESFGGIDVFLAKVDSGGKLLWARALGGTSSDTGYYIQETIDNRFIIAGYTYSFGAGSADIFLAKVDANGEMTSCFSIIEDRTVLMGVVNLIGVLTVTNINPNITDVSPIFTNITGSLIVQDISPASEAVCLPPTLTPTPLFPTPTGKFPSPSAIWPTPTGRFPTSTALWSTSTGRFLTPTMPFPSPTPPVPLTLTPTSPWFVTFGGVNDDICRCVQETSDDAFIITGYTSSFGAGSVDVFLAKVDGNGGLIWAKALGEWSVDQGYFVQETNDGGFVITGYTYSFGAGSSDVLLAKVDNLGALIWAKAIGGTSWDEGYSVQETADGGFIITGDTHSFGPGNSGVLLAKVNSIGALLWAKNFGGSNVDEGYSAQETTDGGFIITGHTYSFGFGGGDIFLAKMDSGGALAWAKVLGGTGGNSGSYVQETADGGFIIIGKTSNFGAGNDDILLAKTNSVGALLWAKTFGGTNADDARSAQETNDGGFIITGMTSSFGAGGEDILLAKVDSVGALLWAKALGGTSSDSGYSVRKTNNGNFIITGQVWGSSSADIFLAKMDGDVEIVACDIIQDITASVIETDISVSLWVANISPTVDDINPTVTDITGSLVVQNINPASWKVCPGTFIPPTPTAPFVTPTALWLTPTGRLSTPTGPIVTPTALWSTPTGRFSTPTAPIVTPTGPLQSPTGRFPSPTYQLPSTPTTTPLVQTLTGRFSTPTGLLRTPTSPWFFAFGGIGSDYGYSVQEAAEGGFIMTGYTKSFGAGGEDILLAKVNDIGTLLWAKAVGNTGNDRGSSLIKTSDGKFILLGRSGSPFLAKIDNNGTLLWAKGFGNTNTYIENVQEISDGGHIITGKGVFGDGGYDILIAKLDNEGALLWAREIEGENIDNGYCVQETSDGGFIIVGYTSSFGAGAEDIVLIKIDSGGNFLWVKLYGGVNGDYGHFVQETSDGGFIITGHTKTWGINWSDIFISKVDSMGNLLWFKTFGGSWDDIPRSIHIVNGGFIITGFVENIGPGNYDILLAKVNNSGTLLWAKAFGGLNNDEGFSVQEILGGGFIITGYMWGVISTDIFLAKVNENGEVRDCLIVEDITAIIEKGDYTADVTVIDLTPYIPLLINDITGDLTVTDIIGSLIVEDINPTSWKVCPGTPIPPTPTAPFVTPTALWSTPTGRFITPTAPHITPTAPGVTPTDLWSTPTGWMQTPTPSWFITLGGVNGDAGYSVHKTADGNFIIAGHTYGFGAGAVDIFLAKMANDKTLLWIKAIGAANYDYGKFVQETADGSFIITGETKSFGAGEKDIFLAKVTNVGTLTWAKVFGGAGWEGGYSVQETADSSLIITGYTGSFGAGSYDIFLAKVNSVGVPLWAKAIGEGNYDHGHSIQKTSDSNFIITGVRSSTGFLIKVTDEGVFLWAKAIGGRNYSVQEMMDGGFIIAGYTWNLGAGGDDILLSKVDSVGTLLWAKAIGGGLDDRGEFVQKTSNGDFIITGYTESFGAGEEDVFLARVDSEGTLLWAKVLGGEDGDIGYSVQEIVDGSFIITGSTSSFGVGSIDIFIAKVDANGEMPFCDMVQDITALLTVTDVTGSLTVTDIMGTLVVTDIMGTLVVADITGSLIVQDISPSRGEVCPIPTPTAYFPSPVLFTPLPSWVMALGKSSSDCAFSIQNTADGNFIITGYTSSDMLLAKVDIKGTVLWAKVLARADYGYSAQEVSDGGFIVTGYTYLGSGSSDVFLAKVNSVGTLLWAKALGGASSDYGKSVQETADTGFVVTGYTGSWSDYDILLIKVDNVGTILWARAFGGGSSEESYSVQETTDSGVIIAGYTGSFGAGNNDILLIKVNNLGTLLWAKAFGGTGYDYGKSVQKTADGGFIITGYTSFGPGSYAVFLVRTDSDGALLWAKTFGGTSGDYGNFVREVSGGFIIVGDTYSFGAGNTDILLVKVDKIGNLLWARTFGGSSWDYGYSVQETIDGGFIVTGKIYGFGAGSDDIFLAKVDANGNPLDCPISQDVTASVIEGDITGFLIVTDITGTLTVTDIVGTLTAMVVTDFLIVQDISLESTMLCPIPTPTPLFSTPVVFTPPPSWVIVLGGTSSDYGYSVQETSDGGFIITGYTSSFGGKVFLIKVDSGSGILWSKALGDASGGYGYFVQETSDSGLIIVGFTTSWPRNILLTKVDNLGNLLWAKIFGGASGDDGYSVQEMTDGCLVIIGRTQSFGAGSYDIFLAKVNSSGGLLWARAIGGGSSDYGYSLQEAADGSIIITGYTESFGAGSSDVFIAKVNNSGTLLWAKALGLVYEDRSYSIQKTADGGGVITGYIYGGLGGADILLAKVDSAGTLIWAKSIGGMGYDNGRFIRETSDNGFIITGMTNSFGDGIEDVLLVKVDSAGGLVWAKIFGGNDEENGYSIQETTDGGFIVTGVTESFGAGNYDIFLAKLFAGGELFDCSIFHDVTALISQTDITELLIMTDIMGFITVTDVTGIITATDITGTFTSQDINPRREIVCPVAPVTPTALIKTPTPKIPVTPTGLFQTPTPLIPIPFFPWVIVFGGTSADRGYSVQETVDGGFVVTGYTTSFGAGNSDILLTKINSEGFPLWSKAIGGNEDERGYSIQETADSGFVITGEIESFGAGDDNMFLIKTNNAGTLLWGKAFGGTSDDRGRFVQETSDGGFIIIGEFEIGDDDIFLAKTDGGGALLWAKAIGSSTSEDGYSVQETSDGGFVIAGEVDDIFFAKIDNTGVLLWAKELNFGDIYSMQRTADGGFIITGETSKFALGDNDVLLIRIDSEGELLWAKMYGFGGDGDSENYGYSVQETSDAGFIVAGKFDEPFPGVDDVLSLLKVDNKGNLLWAKVFETQDDSYGYSVQETSDGGFVVAGYVYGLGAGSSDVFLAKVYANGEGEFCSMIKDITSLIAVINVISALTVTDITSSLWVIDLAGILTTTDITGSLTVQDINPEMGIVCPITPPPTELYSTPTGPLQTPTGLLQTPTGFLQTPTGLLPTPTGFLQTPTGFLQTPTGFLQTPTAPYVTPTDRWLTPTGRLPTPTALWPTPTGFLKTPTGLLPTPTGFLQTPTGFLKTPTGFLQTPTAPYVTPTDRWLTPTGRLPTPTALWLTPTGFLPTPTGLLPTPTGFLQTPTGFLKTPTGFLPTPTGFLQTPTPPVPLTLTPMSPWFITFGGGSDDVCYSVQNIDDGFIIAGNTYSFGAGSVDVFLAKVNVDGALIWAKILGGSSVDQSYSVQQTNEDGFVIAGYTYSFGAGSSDVLFAKVNNLGTLLWAKAIGGASWEEGYSLQETLDGGFIITGNTQSYGSGNSDVLLARMNNLGVLLWAKAFGGGNIDEGYSVQEISDGGFVVTGITFSFGFGNGDIFLVKVNNVGTILWSKALGGTSNNSSFYVHETTDGGFIVVGETENFGAGNKDVLLVKVDNGGVLVWAKTFGGTDVDTGNFVQETADGGFVIIGSTQSFGFGSNDVLLAKVNSSGALLWAKVLGGISNDYGYSVRETSNGGLVITGQWSSSSADIFLARVDGEGNATGCGIIQDITASITETDISVSLWVTNISPTLTDISPTVTDITGSLNVQDISPNSRMICPMTPTAPYVTPTDLWATPTGRFPTLTPFAVTPTARKATPTAPYITPTAPYVTPTGRLLTPTGNLPTVTPGQTQIYPTPTAPRLTPSPRLTPLYSTPTPGQTQRYPTPTVLAVTPTKLWPTPTIRFPTSTPLAVTPTKLWLTPTGMLTTPTGRFQTPTHQFLSTPTSTPLFPTPYFPTPPPPVPPWIIVFGGAADDRGYSAQEVSDGGFIVTGDTLSFGAGSNDIFLSKVSRGGVLFWTKTLGGAGSDYGKATQETADGGFVITGYTSSFGAGSSDVLLAKMGNGGTLVWAKAIGGGSSDRGYSVQETSDGGFIITGYTSSFGAGGDDVLLTKVSSSGTLLWAKTFGGADNDKGYSVQETTDGGFIITGEIEGFGAGEGDLFLAKMDSGGTLAWAKALGRIEDERGKTVQETVDGGFIVTGYIEIGSQEEKNIFLIKVNNVGTILWAKMFGGGMGGENDYSNSVQETVDGGFIVTGYTLSFGFGDNNIFLAKVNSVGVLLWAKMFAWMNDDYGYSIQKTSDGGFIITGSTDGTGAGSDDIILAKVRANGEISYCSTIQDITALVTITDIKAYISAVNISPTVTNINPTVTDITGSLVVQDVNFVSEVVCPVTATPTIKFPTPTAPYVTPTAPAVTPTAPAVTPTAPAVTPTVPYVTPTAPVVTPTAPVVTPTAPVVTPTVPYVTPTAPVVTLTVPYVTPTAPAVTLTVPYATPTAPVVTPTVLYVTPTVPVVTPTVPYVTPTAPVVTLTVPYVTPTVPVVTPTVPYVTPTAPVVTLTVPYVTPTKCFPTSTPQLLPTPTSALFVPTSSWFVTFGGFSNDLTSSIQETSDKGFIITGWTTSFGAGGADVLLAKIDREGALLWAKTLGGGGYDAANSVRETADGGFIIAGNTRSFGAGDKDVLLIRANSAGVPLWAKAIGGGNKEEGYSVQETRDGGFVVTGQVYGFGAGWNDIFLAKVDNTGSLLWVKTIGANNFDYGNFVRETSDGSLIVIGNTDSFGIGGDDIILIKMDSAGSIIWGRAFGGPDDEEGYCVQETRDGGFIITGKTSDFGAGSNDVILAKIDATGALLWAKVFGGANSDRAYYVQETIFGDFIITGETESFGAGGGDDVLLMKVSNTGALLWGKVIRGGDVDHSYSIQEAIDGGFIITGETESFGIGGSDIFIAKVDAKGDMANCFSIVKDVTASITNSDITALFVRTNINPSISDISPSIVDITGLLIVQGVGLLNQWLCPVTPTAVYVTPTAPYITPTAPVVTPTAPVVTPTAPVVTPTAPVMTPTAPVMTPTGLLLTPTAPYVTPSELRVTPTGRLATPTPLIVTPTAPAITPTAPYITPSELHVTPTGRLVTPTPLIVTPTAPAITPTAPYITPSELHVTPTGRLVTPTPLIVTPTAPAITPTAPYITPSELHVTPTGRLVTPTPLIVTPTPLHVTPTALAITPTVGQTQVYPTPTQLVITPTAPVITPTAPHVTPTALMITPTPGQTQVYPTPTPLVITPTAPRITLTAPVITPTAPYVTPSELRVTPTGRLATPTLLIVTPTAPVVTPTAPYVTPSELRVTPTAPVVTPTAPYVTPSKIRVTPTGRLATPTPLMVTPTALAVTSTVLYATPTALAITSTGRLATPTAFVVTPTAPIRTPTDLWATPTGRVPSPTPIGVTPTAPIRTPTDLWATPTGRVPSPTPIVVTPTDLWTTPTGRLITPTAPYVTPSKLRITPTGRLATPTPLIVTPTAPVVTPTAPYVTPSELRVTPTGRLATPTPLKLENQIVQ